MKDDILREIKDRFKEAYDAVDEEYSNSIDDLRFLMGGEEQWPQSIIAERSADSRPCLTINKLHTFANRVIGDIRQNEPSIKVKPVDSYADVKTAEVLTGLIRNIEVQSDAEVVYDTAAESAVRCGYGAWRVVTEYASDDTFNQDIRIRRITNPFTVYWDPAAKMHDRSDARYVFITEKIPKGEFEKMYPNASTSPFEGGKDENYYWGDDRNIRVAEYIKKEETKKKLYLVKGPMGEQYVLDYEPQAPGWTVVKERDVESHKLVWYKVNQGEVLEGPLELPGKYFPIVMVYGDELNVEGESHYSGVIRHAKDPQRLYNYSRSTNAEVVSLAPKSPYLVTAKQIQNYQNIWDTAHKKNYPYLPYDVDPTNPQGIPKRAEPISTNTGLRDEIMIADQEIHDTTGLQLASLGKKSNEQSGRAIMARGREGDIANFTYYDNLGRAVKYTGKVLVDLIPKIYDTARIVRIIGPDNTEKMVPVNTPYPSEEGVPVIHDLTVGKYDVVVTIGPSFNTQREETVNNMIEFIKVVPQAGPLLADILVGSMDWPKSQELEKRLKLLLPPQLQQEAGGQQMTPPPPSPMDMITMRGQAADVQNKELTNEQLFNQIQREKAGVTEGET